MRRFTSTLLVRSALALAACSTGLAQAQTLTVLHAFTRGQDGGFPAAGLTADRVGNLYGTAQQAGPGGGGTVYQLKQVNGDWVFSTLYGFTGLKDGGQPLAGVTVGPDGSFYGTTEGGGNGTGVVFELNPPPAAICGTLPCPWTETALYLFSAYGGSDGAYPFAGVEFDHAGNLYGTTFEGGSYDGGAVYELTPVGGGWTEQVIYSFNPFNGEGAGPSSGVIFDQTGNLYGTTTQGGAGNCGDVYKLTPSEQGWVRSLVYAFQCESDGGSPGGLIFDQSGNIFGTASLGGSGHGGTVYELSPSSGGWTFSLLHAFDGIDGYPGPTGPLTMDADGNLYGTTAFDGAYLKGSIFELMLSSGGWIFTPLYDFTGGSDGAQPIGNVTRDASGNLYGTTYTEGADGSGVVWEFTQSTRHGRVH